MSVNLDSILAQAKELVANAANLAEISELKVHYLGKKGIITQVASQIKDIPNEQKKDFGQKVNLIKDQVIDILNTKTILLEELLLQEKLSKEKVDLSMPGKERPLGSIHPISRTIEELVTIFSRLGFSLEQGPSIESDWYNFTALNIAPNHPSRQMHDTFYLPENVLRTHTSPVQIRTMEKSSPPFRFISFGRTYRSDSDMTHTPMFHQLEAVMVDKNINMGHLKSTLTTLIRLFFQDDTIQVRMRPSFFPFTFASAEIDIRLPNSDKWLEVLGSGLIHQHVLENAGVDSKIYSGFALGLGIERLAMLKYNIKDLRQFFELDSNWLKHFSFSCFHKISLEGGLGA